MPIENVKGEEHNDLLILNEEQAPVSFVQEELSCEILSQSFEELDEQEMQIVNGGVKYGNPKRLLSEALESPTGSEMNGLFHESPPGSPSRSGSRGGLKEWWGKLPVAAKAEGLAAGVVGPVTAFGVSFGGVAIENTVHNKKSSH